MNAARIADHKLCVCVRDSWLVPITTLGQRATLRYPGGNAGQQGELVTFGYNTVGQLASVTSDDGTQYVASTTYNAQGQVTEQRMDSGANGFTRQSVYNANTLRLETLKAGKMTPYEDLQKFAYTYDLAGNVQTLTDSANSGQVQSFGYDWLDRLTTAVTNAAGTGQYNHTYAYNAIGNLTSYNGNAYTYGTKPHAVTGAFGNSYGYDAVGNQTSRTIAGTAYTQSFDYDNRLLGVAGGSVSAAFLYDAEGNRVKGTVAGITTVYLAGVYEYQNGAVTKYYEGGALRRTGYATDNGVFYVLSDQLRSTSVLVNRDGTVNSRNYYYPYGGNRGGSAFSGITTKRFTGQYHEQGLPGGEGLSYYNARWYDAQIGAFISADTLVPSPLAPQTFNRYAYVGGNPLRYVDPTGHMLREDDGGGCASCGKAQTTTYTGTYGVWEPASTSSTWKTFSNLSMVHNEPQTISAFRLPAVTQTGSRNAAVVSGNQSTAVCTAPGSNRATLMSFTAESSLRASAVQWSKLLVAYAIVKYVPQSGTETLGLVANGGVAIDLEVSISASIDSRGNFAPSISFGGGGVAGGSASMGMFYQRTNATDVQQLRGWGGEAGLSLGEAIGGGADYVFGKGYDGYSINAGLSANMAPLPGLAIHGHALHTWQPFGLINFYDWLMMDPFE